MFDKKLLQKLNNPFMCVRRHTICIVSRKTQIFTQNNKSIQMLVFGIKEPAIIIERG